MGIGKEILEPKKNVPKYATIIWIAKHSTSNWMALAESPHFALQTMLDLPRTIPFMSKVLATIDYEFYRKIQIKYIDVLLKYAQIFPFIFRSLSLLSLFFFRNYILNSISSGNDTTSCGTSKCLR